VRVDRDNHGGVTAVHSDRGEHFRVDRDEKNRPVRMVSPEHTTAFFRDNRTGVVKRIETSLGGRWTIDTDHSGNPLEILRGDGRKEHRSYDGLGRILSVRVDGLTVTEISYDGAGRPVSVMDEGALHEYSYGDGEVSHHVDGRFLRSTHSDGDGRIVRRRYHDDTEERFVYSPGGLLLEEEDRTGERRSYRYDERGLLAAVVAEPSGISETYRYDSSGRVSMRTIGDSAFSPIYSGSGQFIGSVLPDGGRITEEHLPGGRVRRVDANGNARMYRYDPAGRVLRILADTGSDHRIEYDGNRRTHSLDGTVIFTEETDSYGRPVVRTYRDGTNEHFRYGISSLPLERVDRRGGVEQWRWDPWDRCIFHRRSDGREERWEYRPDRVIYRSPERREMIIPFDPEGRRENSHSPDISSRVVPPLPGLQGELTASWAGGDRRIVVGDSTSPSGTDGSPWISRLDSFGRITGLTLPGGQEYRLEWNSAGRCLTFQSPWGEPREFIYDPTGNILGWKDATGVTDITTTHGERRVDVSREGHLRSVWADPYGALLRERREYSQTSRREVVIRRDTAGRPVSIGETPSLLQMDMEYPAGSGGFRTEVEGYYVSATTVEAETTHIGVTTPGGSRRSIVVSPRGIGYDNTVEISILPDGDRVMRHRRPSGFSETLDARVYLRDGKGRILAEQAMSGALGEYLYDTDGRLHGVHETEGGGSPLPATGVDRATLHRQWTNLGTDVPVPPAPLRLYRREVPGSTSDILSGPQSPERDGLGRITRVGGTSMTYHPLTDYPFTIETDRSAGGPHHWEIERRSDGEPWYFRSKTDDVLYICLATSVEIGGNVLSIRYWRRYGTEEIRAAHTGDSPRRDSYRDGRFRHDESLPEPPSVVDAVEILLNGYPLYYASAGEDIVPFCDIRGTVTGTYRLDATSPGRTYTPGGDPLFFLGRDRSTDGGGIQREAPFFPAAVPHDRVVTTMAGLPGTEVLLSPSRAYIPELGLFSAPDTDLDGLDWYRFAGGDPVNFQDRTGRYIVPVMTSHLQQDPEWADDQLGSGKGTTLGRAGCTVTTLSNVINQVGGDPISDPGRLNRALTDTYYVNRNLIDPASTAEIIREATGHEAILVSIEPDKVDMDRIISAIADSPSNRYVVSARIETGSRSREGEEVRYHHSLNVAGFDGENRAILHDTSTRGRIRVSKDERVLRYDVYATSTCRVY
jgi:YD repeat-containing protein